MTYADLVAAMEEAAKQAGAASFWAGAKSTNGINYNVPFPVCEFFITQPSQVLATTVRYSIGMGFYGKDEHENALYTSNDGATDSPDNTVQIQSDMDALSLGFILLLREAEGLELVGDVSRVPTIRDGTKIGTGLFIDFTLDVPLPC